MDASTRQVFAEYAARAAEEARVMQRLTPAETLSRLDEFLLPIGENTGELLSLLVRSARPATILELGTSYGYSTLYLAEAAHAVGGRVITLELAAQKSEHARDAIGRAGLAGYVEFWVGDALEMVPTLSGPFDFVLLDLWNELYVPCLELLKPRLAAGAFVVADNMIYPEQARTAASGYRRRVRELGLDSVLLPVGSGVEVSRNS
jgi:predicted O-methyltransferase YrrM